MRYVLIYSGGLDSTVLLYQIRAAGHEVRCLGVDYGQRHRRELRAATAICSQLEVEYQIADLTSLTPLLAGSALTDDLEVPEGHYTDESMKVTVVPNRNMMMLSIGMAWAISLRFDAVAYAAHSGDHAIYPDCRTPFIEAMRRAAVLCDWHGLQLETPFADQSKADIAKLGDQLDVPFELTWSCYKGGRWHCGKCGTCVERREAFERAGIEDPTTYENSRLTGPTGGGPG